MWAHPGKKLLFMGCEFAQNDEWRESQSLDWHLTQYGEHSGVQNLIAEINERYKTNPALWQKDVFADGFQWLVGDDGAGNTLAFARWSEDGEPLLSITNFSPVPHENYRLPLPAPGTWTEVLNTDELKFGGAGVVNQVLVSAPEEHKGFAHSVVMRVPPLATVWLKRN
jgi:1,4-alpha-glucan branching enzyme